MKLNKNCRSCLIELTTENARKRKGVSSGYRNECKACRNKYERRNTQIKRCETCLKECWAKGKRYFCSDTCRFKAYFTINKDTQCWMWREKWCRKGGYGMFMYKGKNGMVASRVSYMLFKGEIPEGMYVCHGCDTPPCVNPEHLFLGTNQENQLDRFKKIFVI